MSDQTTSPEKVFKIVVCEVSRALEHWLHSARRANKAALWREVESIVPF
jgi:hypothetical protein